MGTMELIRTEDEFEGLLEQAVVIVFKHSTWCGISAGAHREVERFASEHPEQTVYKVEVIESRGVSNFIEAKTGVRHESPQLLVLKRGEVVWHGSHGSVTADAIGASLG